MSGNGKGSHLRSYSEVHSLNSDQAFFSIRLKTFSGWTLKIFLFLNYIIVYFIYYDQKQLLG